MANDTPGIRVIPPAIYLAALLVGFLVDWLWPVRLLPDPMRYGLGGLLVLASLVAIYPVLRSFKRAKTPFDTRRAANALVTEGLFGYSRQPRLCVDDRLVRGHRGACRQHVGDHDHGDRDRIFGPARGCGRGTPPRRR